MSYMVHPTAVVEAGAVLRDGVKIWHFCHVRAGADIGEHASFGQGCYVAASAVVGARCRVQNHVSIYDGVELSDDVFVGPNAVFTNVLTPRAHAPRRGSYVRTIIGWGASLGANCTILCGVRVGACAMIGAGSVVIRDVPAHALMVGNPARQVGWSCECGLTLPSCYTCTGCARRYSVRDEVCVRIDDEEGES